MKRRTFIVGLAGAAAGCSALAGLAFPSLAWGQAFPSRPIRLIVPLAAGGGSDLTARLVGAELARTLGQQVVVENIAGGGTVIGAETVVRAAPDGYTLLIGTPSLSINPTLRTDHRFEPIKDLQPVGMITREPYVLVAGKSSNIKTVADLLARARSNPGALNVGSPGIGSGGHLAAELFQIMSGTKFVHVPYRGSSPALSDLLGGQIDLLFATAPVVMPQVQSGTLAALAVSTRTRSKVLPDLKTIAEAGVPGYESYSWYGIFAPAQAPPQIIERLNSSLNEALGTDAVVAAITKEGGEPLPTTPEQLGQILFAEIEKWRRVIIEAGIKPI
jgi:tripartite-type tricarboxylate transporter receptor subunit TctC